MALLYADEDVPLPVVQRLRQLGHDVLTAFEAGQANQSLDDAQQLAFATSLGRSLLTRNRRHFIPLHRRSALHAGIVSITDDPDFAGQADPIDAELAVYSNLAGQHLRVNRQS
ncbi:MAG: DUF5615 family PIN-like protein [Pirellulaceae bacterium]